MKIPCYRCGKEIDTPDEKNADYVMAEDTKVTEPREKTVMLPKTEAELKYEEDRMKKDLEMLWAVAKTCEDTKVIPAGLTIEDIYEEIEGVEQLLEDGLPPNKGVSLGFVTEEVQKTGIICPICYRPTDFIIWGVHRENVLTG